MCMEVIFLKDFKDIVKNIYGVKYLSVTSVGLHPTIQKLSNRIIETHLIDYDENIYGERISIYFYEKERDEVKFENLDKLKERITQDVKNCKHFFKYKTDWFLFLRNLFSSSDYNY